ncbi:MAG: ABC transporter permease subunit [Clostridia bacterium]|nr:ABC transporter permease subunit [Clostridia bacterium]
MSEKKKKGNWLRRLLFPGKELKEIADQQLTEKDVVEITSPGKQVAQKFFRNKLAVGALIVVFLMFCFVIFAPKFMKNYSDSYTEITMKNVPPTLSMMSVPTQMQKEGIRSIDGYGPFSIGVSNAGNVYIWGATQINTSGIDISEIPQEVKDANILYAACGIDHCIAIDDKGKIYGWGNNRLGQFGYTEEAENDPSIVVMPQELHDNGIEDVTQIKKLTCGWQCTAILMNDGTLYIWGNMHTYDNLEHFVDRAGLVDIDFTLNYIVGLDKKGKSIFSGKRGLYKDVRLDTVAGKTTPIDDFVKKHGKIVQIAAASNNVCIIADDGTLGFVGDLPPEAIGIPKLQEGERFIPETINAGQYHYTGITNLGNVYSWGGNHFGQAEEPANLKNVATIYTGGFQSYAVDKDGNLIKAWGHKGHIFGTDTYGADEFERIANGGLMTMTIGAVAVIIEIIIGIIIGCVAGYCGGWVDILLMRIAEVVGNIPLLPFALALSALLAQVNMSATMRIFILMCIIGVLSWTGIAYMLRAQILLARESEYVLAAKSMGVRETRIAIKHILPNVLSVILVQITLGFASCMLTESSMSYLGFGVNYPQPTWGNMLNAATNSTVIKNYWWQWVFTSIFLSITTISINIIGDALRDALDPKSSSKE